MTDAEDKLQKALDFANEQIETLEDEVAQLSADLEEALNQPPDWFTQPEPYEQMYARLHPHRSEWAGTQPAPWSW